MDSLLTLASTQQPRYCTIQYYFIMLLLYVMLSSGKFLFQLKKMHFVLSSSKWIDSLLSINQSHTFANSLFKASSISIMSLCWQKILVPSAYRYVWVFDKACGRSFICNKNNKGPNIVPFGELHSLWSLLPKRGCLMKRKKLYLWDTSENISFIVLSEKLCTPFCLIKFYDLRCQKP